MSINLDNFELDDFGRTSPFVLTSPTSLQACTQLDIEPIELVYRSLEHFEESCCHLPLSQIYRIYEEAETDRQAKLLQCREERKALLQMKMTVTRKNNVNSSLTSSRSTSSSSRVKGEQRQHQQNNNNCIMKKTKSASAIGSRVNFTRNDLQETRSASTSREKRGRLRASSSSTFREKGFISDTESNEGTLNTLPVSLTTSETNCNNCGGSGRIPSSSRSVPDLTKRGNLDFSKVAAGSAEWFGMSPRSKRRHYCLCHLDIRNEHVLAEYLKRYDDILSSPAMSEEDRKIMERMVLKRAKMMEWERQSQDLRDILEIDRMRKYRSSQILAQQWQDKLAEKRRQENIENHRRYVNMQEKLERQQRDLERYLVDRDKRIQKYLEDLSFKKKQGMLEKQKLEALRQMEVSKAIEKLLEEDKLRRQDMRDKLEKRMTEAEIRKSRRERDYWRHVSEMNRLEDIKRALKVEKIEQQARASVDELRQQIEEKEHRARLNQIRNIEQRDRQIVSGAGRHQQQIDKARKLHEELIKGFEEWTKRAYELQLTTQERAGLKHLEEINRRRARAATERVLREERTVEMIKRKHEMEESRKEVMKSVIETKNMKTMKHREEKERYINVSRSRAHHAAELRQKLREKLDPDTFDKKAARAEMELRVLKKNSGVFDVKFNPRLVLGRKCSCRGRMNSFRSSCTGSTSTRSHNGFNGKEKKKGQNAV